MAQYYYTLPIGVELIVRHSIRNELDMELSPGSNVGEQEICKEMDGMMSRDAFHSRDVESGYYGRW